MPETYVSREEFNNLKLEVQELKDEVNEYKGLLQQIDKKIDVIAERISNSDKMDELKLQPITSRVQKLEENQSWMVKTIGATIVGIVIKVIFDINNYVK